MAKTLCEISRELEINQRGRSCFNALKQDRPGSPPVLNDQNIPEEVSCQLDLSCSVQASFDQEKLRQVVVNLITNSLHALQDKQFEEKLLLISTQIIDDEYEIRIYDNGIGMSEDTKKKIFEPLYSTKGFGVGL